MNHFNISDFIVTDILGDGNCLFRALSRAIFATEDNHFTIRNTIVKYITQNWASYNHYIVGDESYGFCISDAKDYHFHMSKSGMYAGHVELNASTVIFNLFITVVHSSDGSVTLIGENSPDKLPVYLLYNGNGYDGHYSLLIRKSNEELNVQCQELKRKSNFCPQPPKRKKALRNTRRKQKEYKRVRRNMESTPEKETRLKSHRNRTAAKRAKETQEESLSRRQINAECTAAARAKETQEESLSRRQINAECTAAARAKETQEESLSRRQINAECTAAARAKETQEESLSRRQINAECTAAARAKETQEESLSRRQINAECTAAARAKETQEESLSRRQINAECTAAARAKETQEDTITRLEAHRKYKSKLQKWKEIENAAYQYDPNTDYCSHDTTNLGEMTITCQHCQALKWKKERPGLCCNSGKVVIDKLCNPPEPLFSLLNWNSQDSQHFLENTRKYNAAFSMTSFGSTKTITEGSFMPTFKIQGQVYHRIGSLHPVANQERKFLQVYFTGDQEQETDQRCQIIPTTKRYIIKDLQEMLHLENNYVRSLKCALDSLKDLQEARLIIHADKTPINEHQRRFNAPATSEVAIILTGEQHGNRDIILHTRDSSVRKIADTHRAYDSLQYPLMFPRGEDGYHILLRQTDPRTQELTQKKISAMDFYAYRIMMRENNFNIVLRFRDVFHQFLTDSLAKIESERLRFIKCNQKKLRAEEYIHLRDAVNGDGNISDVGQLIILPSSFTGGPRYMHERTQDAMTYVRKFGRPDLFVTFTCNPKWIEIQRELLPKQKPNHRHDLLARVFHLKLKVLMNLLEKGKIYGSVCCFMYTIEWQKRGLPHAHILLWLWQSSHLDRVDEFISAEFPDPDEDPELYSVIKSQMIHGPCGVFNPTSPCMKDNKCTKRYPKTFLKETQTGRDGYPLYRRRSPEDGGFTAHIRVKGSDVEVDNRWVVPYSPILSKIFKAHINVEFCNSVKSIKYVCKYVNKGSDMAVFSIEGDDSVHDEVQRYEIGRYISSNEAVWRILNFEIHHHYPTVVHLSVHLENGQRVYFTEANIRERAASAQATTLTAFFDLCKVDEFAQTLFYHQLPNYYTWNKSSRTWNRRKVGQPIPQHPGVKFTHALGRVYTVHPNNSECFHLRILLHEVKGPRSFDEIKTVNGTLCNTYKQACKDLGLLEDDLQWHKTLEEAALIRSPAMLRNLFAIMLQTCAMSSPQDLWKDFKEDMSEDLLHQTRRDANDFDLEINDDILNRVLILIDDKIRLLGGSGIQHFGLPAPERRTTGYDDIFAQHIYNSEKLTAYISAHEPSLVQGQAEAYRKITTAVFSGSGGIFFLDAPGGTGKTFLINLLLAKVRQQGHLALAVASSGIAATLLTGGRTAHSVFKLPLNLNSMESPTCNISRSSKQAKVLKACKFIVWDECTMSHKGALEALDTTLQDLKHTTQRMGGITLLLSGDFRQTLPVIPRGTRADEINACIQKSYLWNETHRLQLTINMRVHLTGDTAAQDFADALLQLGNGSMSLDTADRCIPVNMIGTNVKTFEELKDAVFPNVHQYFRDRKWLCERAILAPTNDSVQVVNDQLLSQLPGETQTYKSFDCAMENEQAVNYPIEFLNSLEISGVPPHLLKLKVGAPIMLLRNLDPPALCNGTRLTVKKLMRNVIEATILTGQSAGQEVFIPRIPVIPTDIPIHFKRVQFPVRLSFAMSINKAQGQSLKVVGLDLQKPCFSHGQLYVGCSRVGSKDNLYIYSGNNKVKNVVYQEVLQYSLY